MKPGDLATLNGLPDPNEETFGQIMMSSRDPVRISQMFQQEKATKARDRSDSNIQGVLTQEDNKQTL